MTEAARSKAWVCGRSLAGTAGSSPAEGMDFCLLWVCCQVEVSATSWSLVQGRPTECGVSECDHEASIIRRPRKKKLTWIRPYIITYAWVSTSVQELNSISLLGCEFEWRKFDFRTHLCASVWVKEERGLYDVRFQVNRALNLKVGGVSIKPNILF